MSRLLVLVLVVALVAAPGCSILSLPVQILKGIYNLLFFWAKAPAPNLLRSAKPVVRAQGAPVPLREGLEAALDDGARGTIYLSKGVSGLPPAALRPPFPGAVPVLLRVTGRTVPEALVARLRSRGLRVSLAGSRYGPSGTGPSPARRPMSPAPAGELQGKAGGDRPTAG